MILIDTEASLVTQGKGAGTLRLRTEEGRREGLAVPTGKTSPREILKKRLMEAFPLEFLRGLLQGKITANRKERRFGHGWENWGGVASL